jgi:endonuclease YncB( thermonuclease family)
VTAVDFLRTSLLAAALFSASPAAADTLTGHPGITDGDTLRLGSTRIRLYGIDSPERHQSCNYADGSALLPPPNSPDSSIGRRSLKFAKDPRRSAADKSTSAP